MYYIKMTKIFQEFCEIFLFQNLTNFFAPVLPILAVGGRVKKISKDCDKKITKVPPKSRFFHEKSSLYKSKCLSPLCRTPENRLRRGFLGGIITPPYAFVQFDEGQRAETKSRREKIVNFFAAVGFFVMNRRYWQNGCLSRLVYGAGMNTASV